MTARPTPEVREVFDYDAELVRYHARLMAALDIEPYARVLDVGCGAGQTTRAVARTAYAGDALGVDISAAMVARARQLSTAEGMTNVGFECGD
ncbi:class I SAM-dependent methyltransferase, partial [Phytoactinopolyspora endophytica]|uniref:class I SAM-dependent methyltransferase n=1 Tax=Phytoactinopolyspora endophytica TaxID=1642495 RepID=UPI00197B3296